MILFERFVVVKDMVVLLCCAHESSMDSAETGIPYGKSVLRRGTIAFG